MGLKIKEEEGHILAGKTKRNGSWVSAEDVTQQAIDAVFQHLVNTQSDSSALQVFTLDKEFSKHGSPYEKFNIEIKLTRIL